MHTPQLDPSVANAAAVSHPCLHMRLVDRVLTETGQGTDRVRCVECGAILLAHALRRRGDSSSDHQ